MSLRILIALTVLAATAATAAPARSDAANAEATPGLATLRARGAARSSAEAIAWLQSTGLYDGLRARVDAVRYQVQPSRAADRGPIEAYEAANPAQGFRARFGADGLEMAPSATSGGAWRWAMRTVAFGRQASVEALPDAEIGGSSNRVEYRYGARLTEWYVNGARGVEQGFTLPEPPPGSRAEPVELVLSVRGDLTPRDAGDAIHFVSATGQPVLGYRDLYAFDAEGRALPSQMLVDGGRIRLVVDDREARYPVTVDPVVYAAAKLAPTGGKADDGFGWWVALAGNTAVVGAPSRETSPGVARGSAFVFVLVAGTWVQQAELAASDGRHLDSFGAAVAISGNTVVVGAPGADPGEKQDAGAAYVFTRTSGAWSQQAKLTATDGAAGDSFGFSVAISSDTIAVGAPDRAAGGAPLAGQVYVFTRSGSTWTERAKLNPAPAGDDAFGFALAIGENADGTTILVGAPFFHRTQAGPSVGRVVVFLGGGAVWARQAALLPADGANGDAFGFAVGLSDNTAVVGAPGHDPGSAPLAGQAYVYTRLRGKWSLQARLRADDGSAGDLFGAGVDVSGDTVVMGAPARTTAAGVAAGQAYLFVRSGKRWSQQLIFHATDAAPLQFFGFGVAIGDSSIVVGAPFHDAGVGPAAGPAYVFAPAQFFAALWVGLQNSDDVGLTVDINVRAVVNGVTIDRQLNGAGTGSTGFKSAILHAVALGTTGSVLPSSVTVSMRVSCSGSSHSNGTARLSYNGRAIDTGTGRDAGSRIEIPGAQSFLRLINGSLALRPDAGTSRQFIDRLLDSSVPCPGRPFTPFGTWSVGAGGSN